MNDDVPLEKSHRYLLFVAHAVDVGTSPYVPDHKSIQYMTF